MGCFNAVISRKVRRKRTTKSLSFRIGATWRRSHSGVSRWGRRRRINYRLISLSKLCLEINFAIRLAVCNQKAQLMKSFKSLFTKGFFEYYFTFPSSEESSELSASCLAFCSWRGLLASSLAYCVSRACEWMVSQLYNMFPKFILLSKENFLCHVRSFFLKLLKQ